MDWPKFIVSNQKEESISIQRVKGVQMQDVYKTYKLCSLPIFHISDTHRTTGCLDDRLLTMMTDTRFYVQWRVGYNFRLANLLEKPSGTLWWVSTLVSVEKSYRNKLTLYISPIKPHLIIISEVFREKSQKTFICSGCASHRQSLLSALIYNKTTIIQLHFCQIWSRKLVL